MSNNESHLAALSMSTEDVLRGRLYTTLVALQCIDSNAKHVVHTPELFGSTADEGFYRIMYIQWNLH